MVIWLVRNLTFLLEKKSLYRRAQQPMFISINKIDRLSWTRICLVMCSSFFFLKFFLTAIQQRAVRVLTIIFVVNANLLFVVRTKIFSVDQLQLKYKIGEIVAAENNCKTSKKRFTSKYRCRSSFLKWHLFQNPFFSGTVSVIRSLVCFLLMLTVAVYGSINDPLRSCTVRFRLHSGLTERDGKHKML